MRHQQEIKDDPDKLVQGINRASRCTYGAEEKISIVRRGQSLFERLCNPKEKTLQLRKEFYFERKTT